MLFVLCALVLVSQVAGQECNSNLDCPGGCCRVDGTAVSGWVMPSNTGDFRGTCGPYLQEGESCSLGYPVASSADCTCALGLSCYPEGGWFSGACRAIGSQTYPPVVGPLPVGDFCSLVETNKNALGLRWYDDRTSYVIGSPKQCYSCRNS